MSTQYEMYVTRGDGACIFEGIFTSKAEMASYLDVPGKTVLSIIKEEYHLVPQRYRNISILNVTEGPSELDEAI